MMDILEAEKDLEGLLISTVKKISKYKSQLTKQMQITTSNNKKYVILQKL